MVRVKWTDFAIENLDDIGNYIQKDNFKYAKLVVEYLFKSTNILKKNPFIGRKVPELNNMQIRELIRGSYRIIYRIDGEQDIDILTVHHSARLLKDIIIN